MKAIGHHRIYCRINHKIEPLCITENSSLFATAGSDGQILMFDVRASSDEEEMTLATSQRPFHSVVFNPVEPRLLVTGLTLENVNFYILSSFNVTFFLGPSFPNFKNDLINSNVNGSGARSLNAN